MGFVLIAIGLIATNVRQYTVDNNQDNDIDRITTIIERTPCGKNAYSKACGIYFNNAVRGALTATSACYIVGKAEDPNFQYAACITEAPQASAEPAAEGPVNSRTGLGEGRGGTSAPQASGPDTEEQTPENPDPAPQDPLVPPPTPQPGPSPPAPTPVAPVAPTQPANVVDGVKEITCPITGSLGLNGVVSPILGC